MGVVDGCCTDSLVPTMADKIRVSSLFNGLRVTFTVKHKGRRPYVFVVAVAHLSVDADYASAVTPTKLTHFHEVSKNLSVPEL